MSDKWTTRVEVRTVVVCIPDADDAMCKTCARKETCEIVQAVYAIQGE